MDADIPGHSSFAWRSLAQSRHYHSKGYAVRIGDGTIVNIWRDKWVSPNSPYKLVSPHQILHATTTVSNLIDHDTRQWKTSLIYNIFWPFKAI
jgi:hypothetical protein